MSGTTYSFNVVVSIHAPARGATIATMASVKPPKCFNPRSREGSDQESCNTSEGCIEFQSTLPRGERQIPLTLRVLPADVSIHAPARGATPYTQDQHCDTNRFNPRSREGSDEICCAANIASSRFQSTLPRGERLHYCSSLILKIKKAVQR